MAIKLPEKTHEIAAVFAAGYRRDRNVFCHDFAIALRRSKTVWGEEILGEQISVRQ
jgi:hypothetical protein